MDIKQRTSSPKLILYLIISIVVLFLIVFVFYSSRLTSAALKELLPSRFTLYSEDSNLISKEFQTRFVVNEVIESKVRNPLSFTLVDNRYWFIIHKIELLPTTSLRSVVHLKLEKSSYSSLEAYRDINKGFFYFKILTGPIKPVSNIYLSLAGDSVSKPIDTDSMIIYNLRLKNASISSISNGTKDIFIEKNDIIKGLVPTSIMFFRKESSYYMCLMASKDSNLEAQGELLKQIVSAK